MKFLRESDKTGHQLADVQARLFSKSAEDQLPSLYFIRAYMRLRETAKMDDLSWLYGNASEQEVYRDAIEATGKKSGGTHFNQREMHWIGYFYRMMAYMTGFSSKELVEMVPPRYLQQVYPMYHSLDIVAAIERVGSDLDLKQETDEERLRRIIRESYPEL